MNEIIYFTEGTNFKLPDEKACSQWVSDVVKAENHNLVTINYIFCSDAHLLKINKEYLSHDYYTDIITFDNSETSKEIEGDIFISIDRVKENASLNDVAFELELKRVMVHGVLHLIGYNDKTAEQQVEMREKENAYLSLCEF